MLTMGFGMKRKSIRTIDDVAQVIAYESGAVLTGMTFTLKDDGWLCTIKVRAVNGKALVTFIHAHDIEGILDIVDAALHTTSITLKWRGDRYIV